MAYPVISRDPIARTELVRESVASHYSECGGQSRLPRHSVFRYGTRPDDSLAGRIDWHSGVYCGKACHDAYHY